MNDDLFNLIKNFTHGILNGRSSRDMCVAVCAPLQAFLSFTVGIETKLINGLIRKNHHCWLKLHDGRIIDPTADQFNSLGFDMPRIFIGTLPYHYKPFTKKTR